MSEVSKAFFVHRKRRLASLDRQRPRIRLDTCTRCVSGRLIEGSDYPVCHSCLTDLCSPIPTIAFYRPVVKSC